MSDNKGHYQGTFYNLSRQATEMRENDATADISNWSVRELKRQINAMFFERLALSKDSRAGRRDGWESFWPAGVRR